ncbi:Major facilitator super domain-containing protein 7, variant 2 [Chamberlinius hualienensis]
MVANIISPSVVSRESDVPVANYIISGFGIAAGIFGLVVRESKPPKPPSLSAAKSERIQQEDSHSYLKLLKKILLNKHFMILSVSMGVKMGIISSLQTMMAQILCPWGYDDDVAGLCCATITLGGFIGAAVFSVIAEKTKKLEEIIKCGFCGAALFCIAFTVLTRVRDIAWILATLTGITGFLAMGTYPTSLEAAVETTYPLDESYSTGFIVEIGQIVGLIMIPIMEALIKPLSYEDQKYQVCNDQLTSTNYDMTYSGIFVSSCAVVSCSLFVIFYKLKYKRLEAEKGKRLASDSLLH